MNKTEEYKRLIIITTLRSHVQQHTLFIQLGRKEKFKSNSRRIDGWMDGLISGGGEKKRKEEEAAQT